MKPTLHRPYRLLAILATGCAFFLNLAAGAGTTNPRGAALKVNAPAERPAMIAVRFHHDACPYCKKLAPQFDRLSRRTGGPSVLFVTLDMTDEASQRQAGLMAGALGLESIWTGDLAKVGTVTFLDTRDTRTVAMYRAGDDGALESALDQAVRALATNP